jgi:pimeloyl-ACP methyl ester carboxylesterase
MAPLLTREHRVIRLDLLGFGGSEKRSGGYSMEDQARLVALTLNRLGVEGAVVVGHSMGFNVATALAEESSELVDRLVSVGQAPDSSYGDTPFISRIGYLPVIGQAAWRLIPDFAIKDAYEAAFAPGYDLESGFVDPDQVLDDSDAMTYTSYDESSNEADDYTDEIPLDERVRRAAIPLLVIFGDEDQVWDPEDSLAAYEDVPGVRMATIEGAGHSPNIEDPEQTARLILEFAADPGDEPEGGLPRRFRRQAEDR